MTDSVLRLAVRDYPTFVLGFGVFCNDNMLAAVASMLELLGSGLCRPRDIFGCMEISSSN